MSSGDFKDAQLPEGPCVFYANNLAFKQDQSFVVSGLRKVRGNPGVKVLSTDVIAGLDGNGFEKMHDSDCESMTALHGSGSDFQFRTYLPIPAIGKQLDECGYTIVEPGDNYTQDEMSNIVQLAEKLLPNAKFAQIMQSARSRLKRL